MSVVINILSVLRRYEAGSYVVPCFNCFHLSVCVVFLRRRRIKARPSVGMVIHVVISKLNTGSRTFIKEVVGLQTEVGPDEESLTDRPVLIG